jgi:hypothetical protein
LIQIKEGDSMHDKKPRCLFCLKPDGPFTREEHIIPESCCNEQIVLPPGVVCDPCNQYFSQLDAHFTHHHHGAFYKLMHVPETKKGKPPTIPLQEGRGYRNEDGTFGLSQSILPGYESDFSMTVGANEIVLNAAFRPKPGDAKLISRFLAKAGLEILYFKDSEEKQMAFESRFDAIRNYARYGSPSSLFVPFIWLRGPWGETVVRRTSLEWKKQKHLNRVLAHIVVPGAAYVIQLEHLEETWVLESLMTGNPRYKIVTDPRQIDTEPINFRLQWGDDSAISAPIKEAQEKNE